MMPLCHSSPSTVIMLIFAQSLVEYQEKTRLRSGFFLAFAFFYPTTTFDEYILSLQIQITHLSDFKIYMPAIMGYIFSFHPILVPIGFFIIMKLLLMLFYKPFNIFYRKK